MKDFKKQLKHNAVPVAAFLGVFWVAASTISVALMGIGNPLMGPAFVTLYVCVPLQVVCALGSETASNKSFLIYDIVMIFMHIINVILSIVFFNF